ncbi:MAG: ribonuclease D [Nanobdellota archaeon]
MKDRTEDIVYIDTAKDLELMCEQLKKQSTIGVDFECENNLHHHGIFLTLIQISDNTTDYVIDVIKLKDIKALVDIFENEKITKIFHDVNFDFRVLNHQYGASVRNVIDTQVLSSLNGEESIGLGGLLKKYFDIAAKKKFQKADWTKRPLTKDMLIYASEDSKYLIPLKEKLEAQLEKKGRSSWAKEECKYLETLDYTYHEQESKDIKGYSKLPGKAKSVLDTLFDFRETIAKKVDMPPHFIINNKKLIELSKQPPKTPKGWVKLRGVHPIIRKYAVMLKKKTDTALLQPVEKKKIRPKRYNQEQRDQFTMLNEKREEIAKQLDIKKSLILSKDQMKEIVLTKTYDSLRSWQKKLIKEKIK